MENNNLKFQISFDLDNIFSANRRERKDGSTQSRRGHLGGLQLTISCELPQEFAAQQLAAAMDQDSGIGRFLATDGPDCLVRYAEALAKAAAILRPEMAASRAQDREDDLAARLICAREEIAREQMKREAEKKAK